MGAGSPAQHRAAFTTSEEAREQQGKPAASPLAAAATAAVVVFREGLEAVLILAALVASLVGATRAYRRPMAAGAAAAVMATFLTWWLSQRLLAGLSSYGERLEGIVSLVAIAMLLLVTNWFAHRVYWKDWTAGLHARKKALLGGMVSGQMLGIGLLGFASVYREGFETVLFVQAVALESGSLIALQGAVVGLAGVAVLGYLAFRLQSRLPYKQMLTATGVLLAAVLVVMVGHAVDVLQEVGWLSHHPIPALALPGWLGSWLGVYATWEGVGLQMAAAAFVAGSYLLAERQAQRRRRHAKVNGRAAPSAAAPQPSEQPPVNG